MARYQVNLAYDGTGFRGFQRQRISRLGEPLTVQDWVEAALRQLGWQGRTILAAGRTDTGVHALGQVIAFDLDWTHSPEALQAALNAALPPEVAAWNIRLAGADFHPRFDALARCYRYRIFCQTVRAPLQERYAWRVWPPVDFGWLEQAAQKLSGKRDFAAFGKPPKREGSTVRTVYSAGWRKQPGAHGETELVFEITANAFLQRMVRRLVHFQVAIGQGRMRVEELSRLLQAPPDYPVQGLAPPQGLTLAAVYYPSDKASPGEQFTWIRDGSGEGERGKNILSESE